MIFLKFFAFMLTNEIILRHQMTGQFGVNLHNMTMGGDYHVSSLQCGIQL